jgi:hypothetical protein
MNDSPQDKALPANARAILQDCRGIASRRLPGLVYEVLKQIKADLMEIAPSTQKYELFALYREALDITQGRWSLIESRFRTHFLNLFDQEVRRAPANHGHVPPPRSAPEEDFTLMDADDLEESLAVNTLANAIKSACVNEMMVLNPRMGSLLKDPEFKLGQNPLSPDVVAEALMTTLQELEGSIKAKLVLVPLFSKYFPPRVQSVYQEINKHLVKKGIMPTLQVHGRKADQEKPNETTEPDKPAGAAVKPAGRARKTPDSPQDLFAMLQQLMSLGRIGNAPVGTPQTEDNSTRGGTGGGGGGGGGDGPATLGGTFPLPPESGANLRAGSIATGSAGLEPPAIFITQLTRLQQGDVVGAEGEKIALEGIGSVELDDGRVNVLHSIRESESARSLGQVDRMTLDIVALLFDFILDDRRIPDAMKALIGRLQIPMLKVALIDKSLFGNKMHPARQVLDTMAKASMGWNEEEGHDSDLYQKISTLVQRIIKDFNDDISLFEVVLTDLKAYVEAQQAAAAELAAQAAQQIKEREQRERPRMMAREEILRRLEYQPLPKLVRQFLNNYWEPLLIKIYSSQGIESETWIKAITTMDDLIWSVTPKISSQDRKKLLVILPKLLKWLDQGLQFLNVPQAERDPFFTELVKYHTEAVRPGLNDAEFAKAFDIAIARPGEVKPIAEESQDFEIVVAASPTEEPKEPDPVLVEEIVTAPEPEYDVEEIVIGDVSWAVGEIDNAGSQDSPASTDFDILVKSLKRGTWIELEQESGELLRAKLAWVSPLRGVYLFTNRLGQKAISINASGLAAKFREGRVRLIDNVPLMDRAVSGLIGRLQKTTP